MRRRHGERGPRGGRGLLPERGPRRDYERPLRSEEGSEGHRARGEKRRRHGPEGRDGHGPRRPNPDKLFDRFDADGDGQLSRAEFLELAESMRRMHERSGSDGPRMGKGRDGRPGPPHAERRGRRRPGPRKGDSDGPRRRHAPREDRDDTSSDASPVLDDSV